MQPIINSQISELKESATLSINQHAIKLLNEGKNICHLGFGESPFPVPDPMQTALRGKFASQTIYFWQRITRIKKSSC